MCEFFTSRDAFMLAIGRTNMLAATFATSRANMHAAASNEPTSLAQRWRANTTVLSFALSFSHLTSGLPFDFSLQPGLIREVAGRRLQQERRRRVRPRLSRPGRWHDGAFPSGWRSMFTFPQPQPAVAAGARAHRRRRGRRRRDGGGPDGVSAVNGGGDGAGGSQLSLRSARSSRVSQIRFDQHESSASVSEREAAGALRGNGGDDFTFSFPRDEWGLYDVHAFGLEILDDTVLENETFTVYDHGLHRLGMLRLRAATSAATATAAATAAAVHAATAAAAAADLPGAAPAAVHEAVAVAAAGGEGGSAFIGFACAAPVGFASFDESDDVSGDQVGVASFVFGYREREAAAYPLQMWAGLAGTLLLALLLEGAWLRRVGPRVGLRAATGWALACAAGALLGAGALWQLRGWRQAVLFCVCFSMNGMLSFDNLFVLILLLQQARLPPQHHLRAINHGVVAALCLRLPLVLCGAALLRRFGWLLLVFAALLLLMGIRMLVWPEPPPPHAPPPPPLVRADAEAAAAAAEAAADANADAAPPADLCAVRCLSACGVPLVWSDATDGAYLARDARGVLCATRLAVVVAAIATSDCLFAMDSVPAVLSLSGSPFVLLSSQCASLLGLRPLYFMLAAVATLLDSMQQALAVVLILIGLKIFLESAGYEVPLLGFAAVLVAWRVVTVCVVLRRRHAGGGGPGGAEQQGPAAPATQLTQLLADDSTRCEGEGG